MLDVSQADALLIAQTPLWDAEEVSLEQAAGRILREAVRADRDFPPFARVSMDGIAIAYTAWQEGRRLFSVLGQIPAGAPPQPSTRPDACWEVATGGVLPPGTDTVIPYEQVQISDGQATVTAKEIRPGQNVHPQGKDRRAGEVLLWEGTLLGAAQVALLATVGKGRVRVTRRPRVALLATGDELVDVEEQPLPWQIRLSNPQALRALIAPWTEGAVLLHSPDDLETLQTVLPPLLEEYPLTVITGGVSAGKRDAVPDVLRAAGVEVLFHKVAQRPGKPFLFARTRAGGAVFALPGNPVSAFMCAVRYILPWLRRASGAEPAPEQWAVLAEPLVFKPDLTWFVPVSIENRRGMLLAHPQPGHGSGDLANLHGTQAFLELPRGREHFAAGEAFRLWPYDYPS